MRGFFRLPGRLAFRNHTVIGHSRHAPARVDAKRATGLARTRAPVILIGPEHLPTEFLSSVEYDAC